MSTSASSSMSPEPNLSPAPKRKRDNKPVDVETSDSEESNSDEDLLEPIEDDTIALSHAEKRRQKKKDKQKAKMEAEGIADGAPPAKKRKLKDGVAAGEGKRQNSVWVGNMSFKTTIDDLKTFFASAGEVTRVHMPTKAIVRPAMKPENRGFAYVDFATVGAKTAAIGLSEQPLIGRRLLIKDGGDFAGRPAATEEDAENTLKTHGHSKAAQKILKVQKQPPASTLFFGNLGFNTTVQSLRDLLDAHRLKKKERKGDTVEAPTPETSEKTAEKSTPTEKVTEKAHDKWIRKVRMGTFEDTGNCKGFAFVDFTTMEHATSALVNPKNHLLDGRKLVVEYASADAVRRGGGAGGRAPNAVGDGAEKAGRHQTKSFDQRPQRIERPQRTTDNVLAFEDDSPSVEAKPTRAPAKPFRQKDFTGGRDHNGRSRPKPGAALALAKRESAAIVPSTGKKIVF